MTIPDLDIPGSIARAWKRPKKNEVLKFHCHGEGFSNIVDFYIESLKPLSAIKNPPLHSKATLTKS